MGGGDKIGASSYVSGYGFAGSQQVVFVSVNYRLAHLGFFYHRATRNTAETSGERSGNYGLLDIIHALNWVQNNIANFGGDSKNITVIGAGDAGSHASALIASPSAEGSFQKAIIQGGSMKSLSKSEAEHFHDDDVPGVRSSSNEVILDLLLLRKVAADRDEARSDINTMSDKSLRAFLEGQSAESIIGVDDDHRGETGALHGLVPLPIRDGFVIPQMSLYELFSDPISYNNVPMIIGSNLHGAKSVMLFEPDYVAWILNRVPIIKDRDFFKMMFKLQSDLKFILGVQEPVKLLTRSRRDVQAPPNIFVYRFDWSDIQSNLFGNWSQLLRASTSLEVDFVLDNFHQREGLSNWSSETTDSERYALSMSIMDYWGSFVYTGNPSRGRSGTLEEWVPWQDRSKNTLLLDNSLKGQIRMEELRYEIESFRTRVISLLSAVKTTRKCKLAAETLQKSTASSALVPYYSKWISYPSLCLDNQQ